MSKCKNCSCKIPAMSIVKSFIYNAKIDCSKCDVDLKIDSLRMLPFNLIFYLVAFVIGFMISEENNSVFWIFALLIWVSIMVIYYSNFAILKLKKIR